ncbi:MAG: RHS repeat-associated protein [Polyangiales bacterium]|jgi:RHS repeat-associated protein
MPHKPPLFVGLLVLFIVACDPDPTNEPYEPIPRTPLTASEIADAIADGLRPAEGHFGWTSAEQGVSESGQPFANVPLVIPPGRAGVQPALALSYAGGTSDGPMGVGWQLSGLSTIARCPRDVGRDGRRNDRLFDDGVQPALCLDGERLIPNECGDDCDASDPFTSADYRLESSAAVVVDQLGELDKEDTVFRVRGRDGQVREFGGTGAVMRSMRFISTPETAAEFPYVEGDEPDWGAPDAVTYAWLLREVRDTSSNKFEVEYSARRSDGALEVLPVSIHYTGHGDERGNRRVDFRYEDRETTPINYVSGFALGAFRRLAEVTTYAPNVEGPVRSYALRYEASEDTGRALLADVTECSLPGYGSSCRQPLVFDYTTRGGFGLSSDVEIQPISPTEWAVLDLNGDGLQELISGGTLTQFDPNNESVGEQYEFRAPHRTYDYNFDGIDEVMGGDGRIYAIDEFGGPGALHYFEGRQVSRLSRNCVGSAAATLYTGNLDARIAGLQANLECGREGFVVLDVDGDGVHELVQPDDVFLADEPEEERIYFRSGFNLPSRTSMTRVYSDMNADGMTDVLGFFHPLEPQVWTNTGEGFLPPVEQPVLVSECAGSSEACDALGRYAAVWSSRDDQTPQSNLSMFPHRIDDYRIADLNQDGLPDVFVLVPVDWFDPVEGHPIDGRLGYPFVYINRGDHFAPFFVGDSYTGNGEEVLVRYSMEIAGSLSAGGSYTQTATHGLMDFDGDGNLDLVLPNQVRRTNPGVSDRLERVKNGDSDLMHFEHSPLHEVHTGVLEGECGDDIRCERYGFVVSSHTTGLGRVFDHEYAGKRFDMARREGLGFEAHRVTERGSGTWVETQYDQQAADASGRRSVAGRPVAELRVQGSNEDGFEVNVRTTEYGNVSFAEGQSTPTHTAVVESTDNRTYELATITEQCAFPCDVRDALEALEERAELLHHVEESFAYDDYGTLRRFQQSVPGEVVTATNWTFDNRPEDFLLGLPRRVTRTSSTTIGDAQTTVDEFGFDDLGRMTTVVRYADEVGMTAEGYSTYTLDEYGLITDVNQVGVGALPRTHRFTYGPDHVFVRSMRNPLGHESDIVVHPATGFAVYARDENERVVTSVQDGFGRIVETNTPVGQAITAYLGDGNLEVHQRAEGAPESRAVIDVYGRLRERQNSVAGYASASTPGYWATQELIWLPNGQLDRIIESDPEGRERGVRPVTNYTYDSRDRVVAITSQVGDGRIREVERFAYEGRSTSWVDADNGGQGTGATRTLTRDLAGRIVRSETTSDEGAQSLAYEYGAFQRLRRTVDDAGNEWTREFDARGRVLRMADSDAGVWRMTYDGLSQLVEEQSDDGEALRIFRRDVLGRPTVLQERDEPGAALHDTAYGWDPVGNLGALQSAYREADDVLRVFVHNELGQTVRSRLEVGPAGGAGAAEAFEFGYEYDAVGQLAFVDYPATSGFAGTAAGRLRVENRYVEGRLAEVRRVEASSDEGVDPDALLWRADRYASSGALLHETYGNGTSTRRSLDPHVGRPSRMWTEGAAGVLSDVALDWNQDSRLRSASESMGPTAGEDVFEYDSLGRLDSWMRDSQMAGDYTYDARGNLTSLQHQAFDSAGSVVESWGHSLGFGGGSVGGHQPQTVDGAATEYDSFGRWRGVDGGDSWSASFNRFDLPTEVVTITTTTSYGYDAFGQRVRSESQSMAGGALTTTSLLNVGDLFERKIVNGQAEYRFAIAGGSGVVAEITEDAAGVTSTSYLHRNHLGSTALRTDETGGVVERYRYTPYGERLNEDGTLFGDPTGGNGASLQSGFGGHRHEASGFVDMSGRQYDPSLGRFLSVDPFNVEPLNAQSYNGYAFVMGDPMTFSDPSGFCRAANVTDAEDCGGSWNPFAPQVRGGGEGGIAGWLNRLMNGGGGDDVHAGEGNTPRRQGPPLVESRIVDVQQGAVPVASSGGVGTTMNAGGHAPGGRRANPGESERSYWAKFWDDFVNGEASYSSGIGTSFAHFAAQTGILGDDAERDASRINDVIGAGALLAYENPETVLEILEFQASRRPGFVTGRFFMGTIVSAGTTPILGIPLTVLSAYGSAVEGAQRGVHASEIFAYSLVPW